MKTNPKSLYIHIPFCNSLCDYCDFTKLLYREDFAIKYIKELENELKSYNPLDVETIYVGGGTPTSLSNELLISLFELLLPFSKKVKEFTVELNPETLTTEKAKIMKRYGVNRASIGVESTNDKILHSINRKHTFDDVKKAISILKDTGIKNISVDLIVGLPNVTKNLFEKDLENLTSLDINHISCYSLTVHPHTVFYSKHINEPDENYSREIYDFAHEFLLKKGFVHYEVSNWCKPSFESKHNLTYWKNEEYYGIGLGASGYVNNIRYKNTSNLERYCLGDHIDESESVCLKDKRTYQLLTSLRTIFGIDLSSFKDQFNEDLLVSKKEEISDMINSNLLRIEKNCLIPTYEGMMVLDSILLRLI